MRTAEVECEAIQWGVGQGGLHTQKSEIEFEGQSRSWTFMYDCGSLESGRKEVLEGAAEWLTDGGQCDIDALWLSHLDTDHMNLVPELFKWLGTRQRTIERVNFPPVTPLERLVLMVASTEYEDGEDTSGDSGLTWGEWREFLIDPGSKLVDWWNSLAAEDGGALLPPEMIALNPAPDEKEQFESDSEELSLVWTGRSFKLVVHALEEPVVLWEVSPFVAPGIYNLKDELEAEIRKLVPELRATDTGFTDEDYVALLERFAADRELLRQLREAILAIHKSKKGESAIPGRTGSLYNMTSIVLYSGPSKHRIAGEDLMHDLLDGRWVLSKARVERKTIRGCGSGAIEHHPPETTNCDQPALPIGWLGTGDANLANDVVRDAFRDEFRGVLSHIWWANIPHHGSKHNSNKKFWPLLTNLRVVGLQAGPKGRRYGHPGPEVVQEALNHATLLVSSDERSHYFKSHQVFVWG